VKIFWSDREGNKPPINCEFTYRSFCSSFSQCCKAEQVELPPPAFAKVVKRSFLPEEPMWKDGVTKALGTKIPKVVLARSCLLELEEKPDPFALTAALKAVSQGAFVFCIQTEEFSFFGATPERLFKRSGRRLTSEALAGTRKRSENRDEDEMLKKELLASAKDRTEVEFVQNYLNETLTSFCVAPPTFAPFTIHQTQNVQHLYSSCQTELKRDASDEELISALHPTPALAGFPKSKALSFINEIEPFKRGLYGGLLGWSDGENSEWIVTIRSCLLQGNRATLFSGAGIVQGSNPSDEWNELNQKIRLYDTIFVDR
jgi:menaquinone-specific isochorismate synthase